MALRLSAGPLVSRWPSRPITQEDADALGGLMLAAYRDTVDYEGESLADAVAEVTGTLDGKYGRLFVAACGLIQLKNKIASAIFVTMFGSPPKPFVAYSMTHPEFKRQGMAAFLLQRAAFEAEKEGFQDLQLVVTEQNTPAVRLYESLGFRALA